MSNQETQLKRQLAQQKKQTKQLLKQLDSRQDLLDALRSGLQKPQPARPTKPAKRPKSGQGGKPAASAVLCLGDWHVGEVVKASEVENINRYDWSTAVKRAWRVTHAFLEWAKIQQSAYAIDECVILGLGDMVSGLIHDELREQAEYPPPVQAVKAGRLFGGLVARLAHDFNRLRVVALAADNHGRLTRGSKAYAAGRGAWSLGYIVNEVARLECCLQGPVSGSFHNVEATRTIVKIQKHNFLVEHGNDVKAWSGFPFNALERKRGREAATRRHMPGKQFDYIVMGHWHQPVVLQDIFVNGGLVGTTALDKDAGRHSRPCQCAMLVHPKHGVFNWLPIYGDAK